MKDMLDTTITFRLTTVEKERIQAFADRDDRTLGSFIRRAALQKCDTIQAQMQLGDLGELFQQMQVEIKKLADAEDKDNDA